MAITVWSTGGWWRAIALATAATTWLSAPAAARADCAPSVRLQGDPELVAGVSAALRARSVDLGEASSCGTVTARVSAADGFVQVDIIDPEGRAVTRHAPDPAMAATVIESWVRRDVSTPLLAARAGPVAPTPEPAPTPVAIAPGRADRGPRAHVGGGLDVGLSGDAAVWTAARLQACIHVDRPCYGVMLRLARDEAVSGKAVDFASTRRTFDAFVVGDVPLRAGRVEVIPGVGLGQVSLTATHPTFLERDDISDTAFRLRGHVGARIALTRRWSFRADGAVEWSPTAEEVIGETEDPDDVLFAGIPVLHTWLGVSLSYGGM